jgi:hypothetical protein
MGPWSRAVGLAVSVSVVAACGAAPEAHDEAAIESTSEAIIGGKPATMYPEAGYLNIDPTPNGSMFICSAALIAPRVVLTAGHCVDARKSWTFYLGKEARTSTSAVTYDWKTGGSQTVDPKLHDIGLVFLEQPITIAEYPTLARQPVPNGSKVTNVGRINNGVVTNSLYAADTVVSDARVIGFPNAYSSSVVIQPGDSGGPDFAVGTHMIVAVNSGANAQLQLLARVDQVYQWIMEQIAARGGSGNTTPPNPPTPPPPPKCPADSEPNNNAWAKAGELPSGESCGELTAKDEDWYRVSVPANTAVNLALGGAGDAVFEIGQGTVSSCKPSMLGLREFSVRSPAAQVLCARVVSPKASAQSYTFTRK